MARTDPLWLPKVKTIPKLTESRAASFWSYVRKGSGCWEWTGTRSGKGYGAFSIGRGSFRAHRITWALANGRDPGRLFVCHTCDNMLCVNPDHLFLATPTANNHDRDQKGRAHIHRGDAHPSSKISRADCDAIRREYATSDASARTIAEKYNVGEVQVRVIIAGKAWGYTTHAAPGKRGKNHARRFVTDADKNEIARLRVDGVSIEKIAKMLRFSSRTIHNAMRSPA